MFCENDFILVYQKDAADQFSLFQFIILASNKVYVLSRHLDVHYRTGLRAHCVSYISGLIFKKSLPWLFRSASLPSLLAFPHSIPSPPVPLPPPHPPPAPPPPAPPPPPRLQCGHSPGGGRCVWFVTGFAHSLIASIPIYHVSSSNKRQLPL